MNCIPVVVGAIQTFSVIAEHHRVHPSSNAVRETVFPGARIEQLPATVIDLVPRIVEDLQKS